MYSDIKSHFVSKFIIAERIIYLLTRSERKITAYLIVLMFVGMVLETLGIGLVLPAIAVMTQEVGQPMSPFLE